MTTLVAMRHCQVGSRHFEIGEELEPNIIPPEIIDHWLDSRWLVEYDSTERRSIYRLLHRFSGATAHQKLTPQEKAKLCL